MVWLLRSTVQVVEGARRVFSSLFKIVPLLSVSLSLSLRPMYRSAGGLKLPPIPPDYHRGVGIDPLLFASLHQPKRGRGSRGGRVISSGVRQMLSGFTSSPSYFFVAVLTAHTCRWSALVRTETDTPYVTSFECGNIQYLLGCLVHTCSIKL